MTQCNNTKITDECVLHCLKNKGHKTKHVFIDEFLAGKKLVTSMNEWQNNRDMRKRK